MSIQNSLKLGSGGNPQFATSLEIAAPDRSWRISLDEANNTWRIGRTPQNDLVLLEDLVSRYHAILQRTAKDCYYLTDMGSSNGSFVNGARISVPRILRNGDQIQIGGHTLTFRGPAVAGVEKSKNSTQDLVLTRHLFAARRITVLVVDVRNFTRLTQQMEQAVLCKMIGTWFRNGGAIMQGRGSSYLKYIGDSIMAVWVHQRPRYEPEEVMNALCAYVELARVSDGLVHEFSLPFDFRIGAGLNTGVGSIGNTGGAALTDFTALGETVNAAFRFETATKELGVDVAIGQNTWLSLTQNHQPKALFQHHLVQLKGYDSPTNVWGATLGGAHSLVSELMAAAEDFNQTRS